MVTGTITYLEEYHIQKNFKSLMKILGRKSFATHIKIVDCLIHSCYSESSLSVEVSKTNAQKLHHYSICMENNDRMIKVA